MFCSCDEGQVIHSGEFIIKLKLLLAFFTSVVINKQLLQLWGECLGVKVSANQGMLELVDVKGFDFVEVVLLEVDRFFDVFVELWWEFVVKQQSELLKLVQGGLEFPHVSGFVI